MKILLVNKFHYLKGGSEKYYFELGKLLKENGHTVAYFSMKNENNITTEDKEYFVDEIDMNTASKFKAFDVIYSPNNKKLMQKALEEFKPDIVHINNFQRQLSSSIIDAIKEKNIPIVMTDHDLNPVCPASAMLYNGKICDECLKKGYLTCVKKSCLKESKAKSFVAYLEKKYYDAHSVFKKIDCIVTPSNFLREKLIYGNLKYSRIEVIPNFVNDTEKKENINGDYAFYFGRLSIEKGIFNLVKAIEKIDNSKLLIAGNGPEKENIELYISKHNLDDRIKVLGFQSPEAIGDLIRNCKFVVVPSICYENCPYSILETMEIGKPIIGSQIGGIPELIEDGKNGFLYPYDDVECLKDKMKILFENDDIANDFGKHSRKLFDEKYSSKQYYKKIEKLYRELIEEKRNA